MLAAASTTSIRKPQVTSAGGHRGGGDTAEARQAELCLLGGFVFTVGGDEMELPFSAQRVFAFLALHDRPLHRVYVAGKLWLDAGQERANASLRTAIWRAQRATGHFINATATHVALSPNVEVDTRLLASRAERVLEHDHDEGDLVRLGAAGELLPDWYDEWLSLERERLHQLRLNALEMLGADLLAAGALESAVRAGLAVITAEPLRERAHRLLIEAYVAQGNRADALRHYRFYAQQVTSQLGLAPASSIDELVQDLRPAPVSP